MQNSLSSTRPVFDQTINWGRACHRGQLLLVVAAVAAVATLLMPRGAAAQGAYIEQVLYTFCSQGGNNCTDGAVPPAGLIMDRSGNLYGTTTEGGNNACSNSFFPVSGCGAAFELSPNGSGGWTYSVIYTFCSQSNCTDGAHPEAGLIMDRSGNLYGTTLQGGNPSNCGVGCGAVFKLAPSGSGGWTETVLYAFCPGPLFCANGEGPNADLLMDQAGNLYGTTVAGGNSPRCGAGCGVVFELAPNGSGGWTYSVLYSFCSQGGSNCSDGAAPVGPLIMDGTGTIYGTTTAGGGTNGNCPNGEAQGCGVVFKLAPNGSGGWTETVLYAFCSQSSCADGANPSAGLILDGAGNLYGTTASGGNTTSKCCGAVYKLAPNGSGGWAYSVIHSFGGADDGATPTAGLIMDAGGSLYGTTGGGGTGSRGVVFRLAPSGGTWTEAVLYNFCLQSNCSDGEGPGGLIMDAAGQLYGTTSGGGHIQECANVNGCGVVFALAPTSSPVITSPLSPSSGSPQTSVTITGTNFTGANNTINFAGGGMSYTINSPQLSSDGTHLSFFATTCPPFQAGQSFGCAALYVPPGTYSVTVSNAKGTSNGVPFTLTGPSSRQPGEPPVLQAGGPPVLSGGRQIPSGGPIEAGGAPAGPAYAALSAPTRDAGGPISAPVARPNSPPADKQSASDLTDYLRLFGSRKVVVACAPDDDAGCGYAGQLATVLRRAGWEAQGPVPIAAIGGTPGRTIGVDVGSGAAEAGTILMNAFARFGIPFHVNPDRDCTIAAPNTVALCIPNTR